MTVEVRLAALGIIADEHPTYGRRRMFVMTLCGGLSKLWSLFGSLVSYGA